MANQVTPTATENPTIQHQTLNVGASPYVGRVPMAASQAPQIEIPNRMSKSKNNHFLLKMSLLLILLLLLITSIGIAFYLNSQNQDIRQEASESVPTTPNFTYHPPFTGTSVLTRSNNGETETINVSIEFDGNPTCTGTNCRAVVKIVPDKFPDMPPSARCRLNTSTVVYYNMLTNTSDLSFPANVSLPINGSNANCNRPLTFCKDGSDSNCERGNLLAYGPPTSQCGGDPYACTYYLTEIPFSLREQELSCGCSQLDVSVSNISFLCEEDNTVITYTKAEDDTSTGGYAYGFNTSQCNIALNTPTPSPTPTVNPTATITPTTMVTQKPTETPPGTPSPTPVAVGPMCLSISMSTVNPKLGDQVTFTCGQVTGVTDYQFRYFEPGSTTPISLSTYNLNISSALTIKKTGTYRVQCRICPSNTDRGQTCANPDWGWDPVTQP